MTTRAAQIECLLTPVIDHRDNSVASGYTVYFYEAGTSNSKNVWTEKEKTNPYTTRTLGSDGTVQVYGDGVYKIDVQDGDGTSIWSGGKDNVKVQANTFTVQTKSDTYTATADDDLIICDGTFTLSIATVANFTHPLIIKRISGTITVDPYSTQTIDGNSTITLTATDDSAVLYPDVSASVWRRADRLNGLTSTVTELNILDGVTSTTNELNILDGVTSTTAELNILDGVTSTTAELNILDGVTATATEINNSSDGIGVTIPKQVIVEIGDWDMDTDASKNVTHGVTVSKIVGVRVLVRADSGTTLEQIPYHNSSSYVLEAWIIQVTNAVNLARLGGGHFDSTNYDSTSFNRGWIIIDYID